MDVTRSGLAAETGIVDALAEYSDVHASQESARGQITRTGRWVQLLPVQRHHTEFLYKLATDETIGHRWLLAGTVPSMEAFEKNLWSGVLAQFIVVERAQSHPVGTVVLYRADFPNGTAYLAAAMIPDLQSSGLGIEALDLMVGYAFVTWNFRKLYLDVPEFNMSQFSNAAASLLEIEGRLREHSYHAGRFWDRLTLALYRERYYAIDRTPLGRRRQRTKKG